MSAAGLIGSQVFDGAPPELRRQLQELVGKMGDAVRELQDSLEDRLVPTKTQRGAYQAQIGELVMADSADASFIIELPNPTQAIAGRGLSVVRMSSANVVTLMPLSGQIDGAALVTLSTTVGVYRVICDGTAWWRYV